MCTQAAEFLRWQDNVIHSPLLILFQVDNIARGAVLSELRGFVARGALGHFSI